MPVCAIILNMDKNRLEKALNTARGVLDEDPNLAVFIVRDFPELVEWELDELAWSMYREGYTPRGDAEYLLSRIEEKMKEET